MQKRMKLTTILTTLVLIISMMNVTVMADVITASDYVTLSVTEDGTNVHVQYALTALAIAEGYGFGTVTTKINAVMFEGSDVTKTIAELGLTKGETVTGSYTLELTREVNGIPESKTIISDTTSLVRTQGSEAFAPATVTWEHAGWQSSHNTTFDRNNSQAPYWIWNSYKVANPSRDEFLELRKSFNIDGTLTGTATLLIAADNKYEVSINGNAVGSGTVWQNSGSYNVSDKLTSGENLMTIVAQNYAGNSNPESNPAGVIFKLTYQIETKETEKMLLEDEFSFDVAEEIIDEELPQAEPVNLWISADDHADVYIDGEMFTHNSSYSSAKQYFTRVSDNPLLAAKAWDNTGVANIAGFKLVLEKNDKTYSSTGSSWYYYFQVNDEGQSLMPPNDINGKDWNDIGYAANGWLPVNSFSLAQAPTPRNWAADSQFPDSTATWIWSPNFDVPTSARIDSPVYLRSMAPLFIWTVTFDTVGGTLIESQSVVDGGIVSPVSSPEKEDFTFDGWDYDFDTIVNSTITITAKWVALVVETPETPSTPEIPSIPTPAAPVINYDLTVSTTEGGTVPGFLGTNTFPSGTNVNLNPVAQDGYEFTGWTGDVNDNIVIMTSSKSVTANFELIVIDQEIAQGAPIEAPKVPEVPEMTEVDTILDEAAPEAAPELISEINDELLPQTGGLPIEALSLMGLTFMGLGVSLKKKTK